MGLGRRLHRHARQRARPRVQLLGPLRVLYEGDWREQHALLPSAYGEGGEPGAWLLLEGSAAAEIASYEHGKYKVGDGWYRACELVHHSAADLAAARAKAKEAAEAAEAAEAEAELATPYEIGTRLFAMGHAGGGAAEWFHAEVVAHRASYPPLVVKYVSTLGGDASSLALPTPRTAFVSQPPS